MVFLGLKTYAQKGIFILYMSLWISFGLLNQLAKTQNVKFNGATAVLLQSLVKIILSTALFLRQDGPPKLLVARAVEHRRVFLLYAIPASLYAGYDILSYVNLRRLDPPTYFLLLQLRLGVTALVHQFMFRTRLNRNQWIAVVATTLGCAIKTIGDSTNTSTTTSTNTAAAEDNNSNASVYGLVLVQILCGTIAGVYNELLLKNQSAIPLNLQNIFMYCNSVLSLFVILTCGLAGRQTLGEAIRWSNFKIMFHPTVLAMISIMSCVGVVTSVFLKLLDSVRKAIASALELVVMPVFFAALFGIPVGLNLACAVAMVSSGIYLYSVPVKETTTAAAVTGGTVVGGVVVDAMINDNDDIVDEMDAERGRDGFGGAPSSGPRGKNSSVSIRTRTSRVIPVSTGDESEGDSSSSCN